MNETLPFVVLLVCLLLGAIVLTLSLSPQDKNHQGNRIQGTSFIPSQMFMGSDGLGGIAINDKSHQFCLLKNQDGPPRILHISHLVGSFLVKNGEIIGEGARTSPKALLSFKKFMRRDVEKTIKNLQASPSQPGHQRIDLLVLIHDEDHPLHFINFLDMETKDGGILYEKSLRTATHWHHELDGLILQADHLGCLQPESGQDGVKQPKNDSIGTSKAL